MVSVVNNLGGLPSPLNLAQVGPQATLQTTLQGGSST